MFGAWRNHAESRINKGFVDVLCLEKPRKTCAWWFSGLFACCESVAFERCMRCACVVFERCLSGARGSDESDESDDGGKASYVVLRQEERFMDGVVFRHAEDAVVVFVVGQHPFDDDPLACFEDIDGAPLEESDVGNFVAGE